MASRVALLLSLLLVVASLVLPNQASSVNKVSDSLVHQQGNLQYGFSQGTLRPQECAPRCTNRCSKTAFKKPCLFFCNKCCTKCLCVPPGTYGNKQVCPCYNNWKTKRGGPKCP